MKYRDCLLMVTLLCFVSCHASSEPLTEKKKAFSVLMATQYNVPAKYTDAVLSHATYLPDVITKITAPYEDQPFSVYIKHFLTDKEINGGAAFWNTHKNVLLMAQKKYGVDAFAIIAILGIETLYGTNQGDFPVLDSLYTLAFYYPPRTYFFTHELAAYIAMSYNASTSPYSIKGSYAGAFGMPQFMPSSYSAYSLAFNPQKKPDIIHNTDDSIISIAYYLERMGWKNNHEQAILRYNSSINYAMTTIQLADAIKKHVS